MKNKKIRAKLMLGFMLTVLLAVIIGVAGMVSIFELRNNITLLNERTSSAILSERLARNVQQQRSAYRGAATYGILDMSKENLAALDDLHILEREYVLLREKLEASLKTSRGKQLLYEIDLAYIPYADSRERLLAVLKDANTSGEDIIREINKPVAHANKFVEKVAKLTDFINDITDEQALQALEDVRLAAIVMITVIVAAVSIAAILSFYIAGRISKPLSIMQKVLVQVGDTGNMDFPYKQLEELRIEGENQDEIGQSLNAFSKLMERFLYIGDNLNAVAEGDLTAEIKLLSENDTMGNSLKSMIDRLNNMFVEINSVATLVSMASYDVANGAHSLTHCNAEQAAAIDSTTLTVCDIAQQAEASESIANNAAKSAQDIHKIAWAGRNKMDSLLAAVEEMKDASYSIENVLKLIDEIAFNINILSLNAAVEAAHAGTGGKGFAIVADEVRRLAVRSAEAAQETAQLIAVNIEKSNMGMAVSRQTADNFKLIVSGVEDTTEMLDIISQQSKDAKEATKQVTVAMNQVSHVVNQNSETGEKSAAASEELSIQAQMLKQLIAHFKLKENIILTADTNG